MRRSIWLFLFAVIALCAVVGLLSARKGFDSMQQWKSPDGKRSIMCMGYSRTAGWKFKWPPWRYQFTAFNETNYSGTMLLKDFPEQVTDFTVAWEEKTAVLRWHGGVKSAVVRFYDYSAIWEL